MGLSWKLLIDSKIFDFQHESGVSGGRLRREVVRSPSSSLLISLRWIGWPKWWVLAVRQLVLQSFTRFGGTGIRLFWPNDATTSMAFFLHFLSIGKR